MRSTIEKKEIKTLFKGILEQILKLPIEERVIALDFDNTCIRGDLGEAVQNHLLDAMTLPLHAHDRIAIGGHPFAEALAPYLDDAQAPRDLDAGAKERVRHIVSTEYLRIMNEDGHREGYLYSVRLLAGMTPAAVEELALLAFQHELKKTMGKRLIHAPEGLDRPMYTREDGLRIHEEMRDFILDAQALGIRVLVISASCHWVVAPIAESYFGIARDDIWGIHTALNEDGTLAAQCVEPIPYGAGKVASIQKVAGRSASFAAGDARTDLEMLRSATLNSLLLDRGNEALKQEGISSGWLIIPQQALTCISETE